MTDRPGVPNRGSTILLLTAATLVACGGVQSEPSKDPATEATKPASTAPAASGTEQDLPFTASNFDRSTVIENEWLPMKPGTRFEYNGSNVEDDGKVVPHRIVMHVTDLTKIIGGVRCVVNYDLDYNDGELVEAELAFFAQDKDGNIWRMGEYPEEYEDGKFIAASPWLHGLEDARAGIEMLARPKLGTASYAQGWGPAVNWTDRARVDQMGQKTTVKAGSYEDVLVIAETSESEPGAQQLKHFAKGVGNVRVGWRGAGEKTKETLELTKVDTLDASADQAASR